MGTRTTKLNLYKPNTDDVDWGSLVDGNFDSIDADSISQDAALDAETATRTTNDNIEITARIAGDSTSLSSAKSYTDTETARATAAEALKAPLDSAALTGTPTAPTPAAANNSTAIATTAFVESEISLRSPVLSVAGRTGAITLTEGDIASLTSDLATCEKIANKDIASGYAGLDGSGKLKTSEAPTWNQNTTGTAANLSGTPGLPNGTTATTQTVDDNSTKLATTAYITNQLSASGDGTPIIDGTAARGTSTHTARADHVHPTDTSRQATLTGTGIARNTGASSELSGDTTTSGSNSTTVVKVNGGSIPGSEVVVGTNSSSQIVAVTNQNANLVYAGPASGGAAKPTFRAIAVADLPSGLNQTEIDVDTIKLDHTNQDIILNRSAKATLSMTGNVLQTGSSIQQQLSTPSTPVITPTNGSGSTWGYKVAARDSLGYTIASSEGTTATGATTLDSTHTNAISWTAVPSAVSYDVYRTTTATSPNTKGLIGNTVNLNLTDNGLAGDTTNPPVVNTTGNSSSAGQVMGSLAGSGPYVYGGIGPVPATTTSNGVISPNGINEVSLYMFYIPFTITFRKVTFNLTTKSTTAGIKVNFGLYDLNLNLVLDSGAIDVGSGATNGMVTQAFTAVTVPTGWYYFAQSCQDNLTAFALTSLPGAANAWLDKNVNRVGRFNNLAANGVLPKTLGSNFLSAEGVCVLCILES
jgi:hypothetical protein